MTLNRNVEFAYLIALGCLVGTAVGCGDSVPSATGHDASNEDAGPDGAVDRNTPVLLPPDAVPTMDVSADNRPRGVDATVVSPMDAAVVPDAPAAMDTLPARDTSSPMLDGAVTLPQPSPMSVAVYDEASLIDLLLTFPAGEWDRLLTLTGDADTRWVMCAVAGLGTPATPASCRRKGDPLDWGLERKPQIVVRFNRTNPDGRFRGLRRLNLEAFDGAAAPIRDRIGMWMMREAGINAPRVNSARVFRDGQLLGVYQNIEAEDKEFLEDHFGADAGGNLWEEGNDLKTNEEMPNRTRLTAFEALVSAEPLNGDHTAFFAALPMHIDVAQVLLEMAGETALIADDNFSNGSTNFSFYEHPSRGLMVLPWDFDSILKGPVTADLYDYRGASDAPNKLRRLMNQNPVWKKQFEDALVRIRDQHLSRIPARVDLVCAQIRAAVRADPNRSSTFEDFQNDCALVKERATQRVAAIKELLGR